MFRCISAATTGRLVLCGWRLEGCFKSKIGGHKMNKRRIISYWRLKYFLPVPRTYYTMHLYNYTLHCTVLIKSLPHWRRSRSRQKVVGDFFSTSTSMSVWTSHYVPLRYSKKRGKSQADKWGSEREAHLVECFEGIEKSSLHLIAAIHDTEQATKLHRQSAFAENNR